MSTRFLNLVPAGFSLTFRSSVLLTAAALSPEIVAQSLFVPRIEHDRFISLCRPIVLLALLRLWVDYLRTAILIDDALMSFSYVALVRAIIIRGQVLNEIESPCRMGLLFLTVLVQRWCSSTSACLEYRS